MNHQFNKSMSSEFSIEDNDSMTIETDEESVELEEMRKNVVRIEDFGDSNDNNDGRFNNGFDEENSSFNIESDSDESSSKELSPKDLENFQFFLLPKIENAEKRQNEKLDNDLFKSQETDETIQESFKSHEIHEIQNLQNIHENHETHSNQNPDQTFSQLGSKFTLQRVLSPNSDQKREFSLTLAYF